MLGVQRLASENSSGASYYCLQLKYFNCTKKFIGQNGSQNPWHEWTKKLTVFTLRLTLQFHEKFIGQSDAQSPLNGMSETESWLIPISAF